MTLTLKRVLERDLEDKKTITWHREDETDLILI